VLQSLARQEIIQLERLNAHSLTIIADQSLSLSDKQVAIDKMGYNYKVAKFSRATQQAIFIILGTENYKQLSNWVGNRWQIEQTLHGAPKAVTGARTFEIYATRYDSGGAYYAALPDQCVKLTNGGLQTCTDKGYTVGMVYDVYLSYKKGTAARVGESGPWNIDDTYWATWGDPTPRRMFADLALGMPEAQAAYFNGYNGGLDQFGRVVTAPYGIDLARQVSIDIGLQPGNNDWINVTFMWTEGWGTGSGSLEGGETINGNGSSGSEIIDPVKVVTPGPDGSIVHKVQPGETYWAIAIAYETTIAEIYRLNNLDENSPIWPGDELLIQPAQINATSNVEEITTEVTERVTVTTKPSRTPRPTRTKKPPDPTNTALSDETYPLEAASQSSDRSLKPLLTGGIAFVIAGLLLMLVGRMMNR
jgi:LysM repeat protein